MSIPDFQNLMLPVLESANDEQEHASRDATDNMARLFQLTDAEGEELLPAGHSFREVLMVPCRAYNMLY
jgi:restriction system protein